MDWTNDSYFGGPKELESSAASNGHGLFSQNRLFEVIETLLLGEAIVLEKGVYLLMDTYA